MRGGSHDAPTLSGEVGTAVPPSIDPGAETLGETPLTRASGPPRDGADTLEVPQRIDRFAVLDALGAGGMGVVYAAYDPDLDRRVALKLIYSARGGSGDDERVLAEARAMARVSHPNVVTVFEVGRYADRVFIAMEYVRGATLRQWRKAEPRAWRDIVAAFVEAARGLSAVHAVGLVHRDFKPDNMMIREDGRAQVMDFGVARDEGLDGPTSGRDRPFAGLVGTPAYMAPEQFLGQRADARSDQFAFCVSLYEALFDERPFVGESLVELATSVTEGMPRSPVGDVPVPRVLIDIVRRGLSREPAARWPDMKTLAVALEDAIRPPQRRSRALAVAGGSLAVAIALATWLARDDRTCEGGEARYGEVWSPDRAATVERALSAAAPSYGSDSAERVARGLEEYGRAWARQHHEACQATRVSKVQSEALLDRRMQCLARRLVELDETVRVLEAADATTAEHAVDAIEALRGPDRCADVEALERGIEPADTETARRVEETERTHARVEALVRAGQLDEATALATALREEAEDIGYDPLVGEAMYHEGQLAEELGRTSEALTRYEAAYFVARRGGAMEPALLAAVGLSTAISQTTANSEAAALWFRLGRAELGEPPAPDLLATLINAQATVDFNAARHHAALEGFRRALETDPAATTMTKATIRANIGTVLNQLGHHREALEMAEETLAIAQEHYGPDHPTTAGFLYDVANTQGDLGDYSASIANHLRVIEIRERTLGRDHFRVGLSLNNLGYVYHAAGRYEEARAVARRAIEVFERKLEADHPYAGAAQNLLGMIERDTGHLQEAIAALERSLAIQHKQNVDGAHLAAVLGNLSSAELEAGAIENAERHARTALEVHTRSHAEDPNTASSLSTLGKVLLHRKQWNEAVPLLERALALVEQAGTAPEEMAIYGFMLARALDGAGERERAIERAREALARWRESQGRARAEQVAEIEAWLRERGG